MLIPAQAGIHTPAARSPLDYIPGGERFTGTSSPYLPTNLRSGIGTTLGTVAW